MTTAHRLNDALIFRGLLLEYATLGWNIVGVTVLTVAAVSSHSVALAGFGLDALVEIAVSAVVVRELAGTGEDRRRPAVRLIGGCCALLALYLLVQSTFALATGFHPHRSPLGVGWTAATAVVMFALATGKARTGAALNSPVLTTEGRATLAYGLLAAVLLTGLVLNQVAGWWWADLAAGYGLACYTARRAKKILTGEH